MKRGSIPQARGFDSQTRKENFAVRQSLSRKGLDLTLPKDAANPPWCKLPPDTGQTDGF